jgi:hypothetical protein
MINYLFGIIEALFKTDVKQNATANGKRMASALTIACCFHKVVIEKKWSIPFEIVAALLSMLRLMPDAEIQRCIDWDVVNELLPATIRKAAYDATHSLIIYLSHNRHFLQPAWLFALPFLHFLKGTSQPFRTIACRPQDIPWGDQVIGLRQIKDLIKDTEIG